MALNKQIRKWDILLVDLEPVRGSEINKIRPCLVVSPNVMNQFLQTLIVAPLTTSEKNYPTRIRTNFKGRPGEICLDYLKSIDKGRMIKTEGTLPHHLRKTVNELLREMFNEEYFTCC
jgi:mRNA interferase MazF